MQELIVKEDVKALVAGAASFGGGGFSSPGAKKFNPPLRMRRGIWTLGSGEDEVKLATGDKIGVVATSFTHGWICWDAGGSKVLGSITVPASQPFPEQPAEKTDQPGSRWVKNLGFSGEIVSGKQKGQPFTYEQSNYGGTRAIDKLFQTIVARIVAGEEAINPFATLDSEAYTNKQGIKVWNPIFAIVDWVAI